MEFDGHSDRRVHGRCEDVEKGSHSGEENCRNLRSRGGFGSRMKKGGDLKGRRVPRGSAAALDYAEVCASRPRGNILARDFLDALAFLERGGGAPTSKALLQKKVNNKTRSNDMMAQVSTWHCYNRFGQRKTCPCVQD